MWLSVTEVNDQLLGLAGVKEKAVPLAPVAEGTRQVPVLPTCSSLTQATIAVSSEYFWT